MQKCKSRHKSALRSADLNKITQGRPSMAFIKKKRVGDFRRSRRPTLTYFGDNFPWFHFLVAGGLRSLAGPCHRNRRALLVVRLFLLALYIISAVHEMCNLQQQTGSWEDVLNVSQSASRPLKDDRREDKNGYNYFSKLCN